MKIIKIPPNDYISNIRADKTIYLGLQSNVFCISKTREDLLREEYRLKNSFKFNASFYLGKLLIENKAISFVPFNIKR